MSKTLPSFRRSRTPSLGGLCALALFTWAAPLCAATLTVPAQYATIQAAVNAAAAGDTVLVADGTYTGPGDVDVDFSGKNITVTSQHGPASTIIDCQASAATLSHRGFIMQSGELNATLSGFTVKNGYQVQNDSGVASGSGGGIYLGSNTPGSSLTVSNCIITHCLADSGYNGGVGGGIYAQCNSAGAASSITISNCTITSNTAVFDGGGIDSSAAGNGTITVTGCTITGNTAADPYGSGVGSGGGVYDSTDSLVSTPGSGAITVSACTIANNTAAYEGGGAYNVNNTYGTIALNNCTVTGNSAPAGNAGTGGGGGVYDYGGTQTVTNCSFTGNSGGGLHNSSAYLNNVILYGDTGGELANPGTEPFRNCDVQGGLPAGATDGGGNINADPLWVNPPTDLHLQAGSPCIGKGLLIAGVLTDKDGKTRANPPSIGAYEGGAGAAKAATTTTVTAAPNPSPPGQAVVLSVLVSNGTQTAPSGTVQLSYNGANFGPAGALDTTGQVSFTINGLTAAGSYAFTATYSGDANDQASSGAVTQTVSAATVTHLLWSNTDGKAAFWNVDTAGNPTVAGVFGPFADGQSLWHATALATGPDGVSHILWNNADGHAALWNVTDSGSATVVAGFGPYSDGGNLWSAASLSVGPDNVIHLLWTNPDRKAAFWSVTQSGSVTGVTGYGPYFDGSGTANPWIAFGVSTGPDNVSHLLWANTDGKGAFWNLGANGSIAGITGYGPYTDGSASNLWYANAVSTGPDNVSHLLWNNVDAKAAFWSVSSADGSIGGVTGYGPFFDGSSPWHAVALATGPDAVSRLVWNNPDGHAALWLLNGSGGVAGVTGYGPFTDGSASSLWSAVGVSAGP